MRPPPSLPATVRSPVASCAPRLTDRHRPRRRRGIQRRASAIKLCRTGSGGPVKRAGACTAEVRGSNPLRSRKSARARAGSLSRSAAPLAAHRNSPSPAQRPSLPPASPACGHGGRNSVRKLPRLPGASSRHREAGIDRGQREHRRTSGKKQASDDRGNEEQNEQIETSERPAEARRCYCGRDTSARYSNGRIGCRSRDSAQCQQSYCAILMNWTAPLLRSTATNTGVIVPPASFTMLDVMFAGRCRWAALSCR
jgi:hypothetical protein